MVKKKILILTALFILGCTKDQNTLYNNRIVMLGDSITEIAGNWNKRFNITENTVFFNCGISGNKTADILNRLGNVLLKKPTHIFIMAGINDLNSPINLSQIADNLIKILIRIKNYNKNCQIYIQSVLPINTVDFNETNRINQTHIPQLNDMYLDISIKYNCTFINLYDIFIDEKGFLQKEITYDGIHLNENGINKWCNILKTIILRDIKL